MNPLFQALFGGSTPVQPQMGQSAPMMPGAGFGSVLQRAQQIASTMQNPQQLVKQFLPDAPAELSGNPEQLIDWMVQTGKVNPQMVQMARQMMGR